MVKGYSRIQIALHWLVAVLIVVQVVAHEPMAEAWRVVRDGAVPQMSVMVWWHIIGGGLVLALVLWRLVLRLTRGAPEVPKSTPAMEWAGRLGHLGLYALMIVVPATGMVAWFGGIEAAAEAHEALKTLLIVLVLVHLAAAVWHQVVLKDGLMNRMRKPLD